MIVFDSTLIITIYPLCCNVVFLCSPYFQTRPIFLLSCPKMTMPGLHDKGRMIDHSLDPHDQLAPVYMHACTYVRMYVCTCMYVCMYVCMHVCMYVTMYVCT